MSAVLLRTDFDVERVQGEGSDEMICKAARVSTIGEASIDSKESAGLINFLMKNRHGSPFEHAFMTVRITAPIFVWREYMRHRIGVSYNEQSGRYMKLEPVFYVPGASRPLCQVGKAGQYDFVPGTTEQHVGTLDELYAAYSASWNAYERMLENGIAKEVARMCLPVAIYSTAYVSMNPRSIMSFLSLRTKHEESFFPSYPQWEINRVADQLENHFKEAFPLTHMAFDNNGRVSP